MTSTYNALRYRKHTAFKTAVPLVCAALVSLTFAVRIAAKVPGDIFQVILGVVLILLSVFLIFFHKRIKIKPTVSNGIFVGALGGVLSGLFATGGPPVVLYLTSATASNIAYYATIQFYFSITNIYANVVRLASGMIDGTILLYTLIGLFGCLCGDFLGRKVFDRLDAHQLKMVIYIGMIISGILMLC